MNKQDLKNGMIYEKRNGLIFYIILDTVYKLNDSNNTEMGTLDDVLTYYNDDLTYKGSKWSDIMIIRDAEGKLLWEREEVDWAKVPKDTKVLVRNSKDEEWHKRYFSKYKDGRFYTFNMGGTSWSTSDETFWKECKLVELEQKEYTFDEVECLFEEYCDKIDNCNECEYSGDCKDSWKNDNFTITRKIINKGR